MIQASPAIVGVSRRILGVFLQFHGVAADTLNDVMASRISHRIPCMRIPGPVPFPAESGAIGDDDQ